MPIELVPHFAVTLAKMLLVICIFILLLYITKQSVI
jgi:hypothetical protein